MEADSPFRPGGPTIVINATPTAAPSATLLPGPTEGEVDCLFANLTAQDAWIAYGSSSTAASNNAVIPLIGTPSAAMPLKGNTSRVFTLSANIFIAAICAVGLSSISVTPGYGS